MDNTITQRFYTATISVYNCLSDVTTEEDMEKICDSLRSISNGKDIYIEDYYVDESKEFGWIKLGTPYDSYYEYECEYYPGCSAHITNDPYYSYPAEPPEMYCYQSTAELLGDIWKCPKEYDYDVVDEWFDTEEELWDMINEEPDW